jgi:hypothetical protein
MSLRPVALTLALLASAAGWRVAGDSSDERAAASARCFAVADYTQGKVFLVEGERPVWEYDAPDSNDLWVLANGNLLFTTGHGVVEVTRQKRVVFRYESASDVYACQRLANGDTFVGECSAGRLLEVSPAGKIEKEVRLLREGEDGGHAFMRNARRLANGHYLVAHYGGQLVREYDAGGKPVWEAPAPGGPHSVARLAAGTTLVATADRDGAEPRLLEIAPDGRVAWELSNDDLPGRPLRFLGGFHRLANGNTVLSNWLGHGHLGEAPLLLEVTREKKVVWTWANHQALRTASSVVMLDGPADPFSTIH